jgi:hypothetical protein
MWRRDAGADVASPLLALGSETRTEVRTEGPLCLRWSHWASAEGAQGSAADHGGGGETQGADVASPLSGLGSEKALERCSMASGIRARIGIRTSSNTHNNRGN